MCDLDDEWDNFLNNTEIETQSNNSEPRTQYFKDNKPQNIPECSNIKISTKTKIIYLNKPINLNDLFWKLQLIDYMDLKEGILKTILVWCSCSRLSIGFLGLVSLRAVIWR